MFPNWHMATMIEADKTAVIDVGSNSVRLVVYYGAKRAPLQFFNEKVVCGLGRGLAETGKLHPKGRIRALNAIKRFVETTKRMQVSSIQTVATAAVRNAEDGEEFCAQVLSETNLKLRVVSGSEEGALSAMGIFYCRHQAVGLVCDMGGSSMELAHIGDAEVKSSQTSELGPLQLLKFEGDPKRLNAEIETRLDNLVQSFEPQDTLYMIGGTIRAIANLDIKLKAYPLSVVNEYQISTPEMKGLLKWIIKSDLDQIEAAEAISSDRLAYVPIVARVLLGLLDRLKPDEIVFASSGIREGVLYENMPSNIKLRDPLIEACQFFEESDARFKDFGTTLYEWLLPLFPDANTDRKRLIWAACLLHDVTWKAHPDYRADVSFDYVTRSNLVGINHKERIFLAQVLIHRYKNKSKVEKLEGLNAILPNEDQVQAEILGRAMRIGAMLGGPDVVHMGRLNCNGKILELVIDQHSSELIGEVVERRLSGLAKAMGKTAVVCVE